MDLTRRELLRYVGDAGQVLGVKEYILQGGRAQGVKAIDANNGRGLVFTVVADRCLDIAQISYKGTNIGYISKAGLAAPQYFDDQGLGFLRNFFAGFLTTCGLRNVGAPCEENGEAFGLHGRISNTPAEEVYTRVDWTNRGPVLKIRGRMREAVLFGENFVLTREITCSCQDNRITISDEIENDGYSPEPLMLLYHFNLGYPLLCEHARLISPTMSIRPRDTGARKGIDEYDTFQKPTPGYREQVFYHDLRTDGAGNTIVALVNDRLGLGLAIHFNKKELFNLTQWKLMGEGDYVVGIEPCNCYVQGRVDSRDKGVLDVMAPGEIRRFTLTAVILDGTNEIGAMEERISSL